MADRITPDMAMARPEGAVDAHIDRTLADTFPASDAPFWTLGMESLEYTLADLRLEHDRIALLIYRDGFAATVQWVWRTMRSYRRAVLDKHGFARLPLYRYRFIQSYCDFKHWLGRVEGHHYAAPHAP